MSTDLYFAAPVRPGDPDDRPVDPAAVDSVAAVDSTAGDVVTEIETDDTDATENAVTQSSSDRTSLRELIDDRDVGAVLTWLDEHAPHRIADELARMNAVDAGLAFRLLDKDRALEVFEELEPVDQQQILSGLRDQSFRELVEGMDPDDRARMLREAPATVAKKVLAGLSPRERRMTAALLGYPEGSAGRYMTPEVVALHRDLTAAEALGVVRAKGAHAETVYTLPVVDDGRRLTGVVEMRELVLSDPSTPLTELTVTEPVFARATDAALGAVAGSFPDRDVSGAYVSGAPRSEAGPVGQELVSECGADVQRKSVIVDFVFPAMLPDAAHSYGAAVVSIVDGQYSVWRTA